MSQIIRKGVKSIAKSGSAELTGDVTLSEGTNVTITQTGQDIEIAATGGSGSGDVTGPASSTDNAIARFDSTTGKVIQNSTVTVDDSGNVYTGGNIASEFGEITAPSVVATNMTAGLTLSSNTINERSAGSGVTVDGVLIKDTTVDVNGTADAIILDADADTTISAPTDDQIDFEIGGVDVVQFNSTGIEVAGGLSLSNALNVSDGGTGATSLASGNVLVGAGTSPVTTSKSAPTGDFVGTSDTQTLTNKTLTTPVVDQFGTASGLGASWASWTPTLTNLSGGTLNYAKYKQLGKIVFFRFKYTLAGAGVAGEIDITYPVAANADLVDAAVGPHNCSVVLRDVSASSSYVGIVMHNDANKFRLRYQNATPVYAAISSTAPFTWASGDLIIISGYYEAA